MKIVIALTIALLILTLYSFAQTSDQLDDLTLQQQREVVARWTR